MKNNIKIIISFCSGTLTVLLFIFLMWIVTNQYDIKYTYVQKGEITDVIVPINTYVYGAVYPGGTYFSGGNLERKSFDELLDQAKHEFNSYYWFEQNAANPDVDIIRIEIEVFFRDKKVGKVKGNN